MGLGLRKEGGGFWADSGWVGWEFGLGSGLVPVSYSLSLKEMIFIIGDP
jgi:hypothetical protein